MAALQLFAIAPQGMGLGQKAQHVALLRIVQHWQHIGLRLLENIHGLADGHLRQEQGAIGQGERGHQRLRFLERRVEISGEHRPGVAAVLVKEERLTLATGRKQDPRRLDGHVMGQGARILAHQPRHGEIAQPADIRWTADGFAAQMEAPGGEGIAKAGAHDERGYGASHETGRRDVEIAGHLQRQNGHGDGRAKHAGREGGHASHRRRARRHGEGNPQGDAFPIEASEHAADQQRGEEEAAAIARSQRHRRGAAFQQRQSHQQPQRQGMDQIGLQGAVARAHDLRADQRHGAHHEPSQHGPESGRKTAAVEQTIDNGDAAHQGDARQRHAGGQHEQVYETHALDWRHRSRNEQKVMPHEGLGDQGRHDGAGRHRHQGANAIGAQNHLERIERPRQRRAESRRYGPRRSASDQQAQIAAPRREPSPEQGRHGRRDLRIGRLQPNRGAAGVGEEGLQRDVEAAPHGHAPAIERVGLDGVGHPSIEPLARPQGERSQHESAKHRRRHHPPPAQIRGDGEVAPTLKAEQDFMHKLGGPGERRHQQSRQQPHQHAHKDKPELSGANEGAHPQGEEGIKLLRGDGSHRNQC